MQHLKTLLSGGSGTALDRLLVYRPALVTVAGSVNAALFLAQALHWWYKSGRRPFYKFNAPCEHTLYREGDSWQEELRLGRAAFENARDGVATKVTRGSSRKEILSFSPIIYWTDSNRVTWYQVNEILVWRLLCAALRIEAEAPEASVVSSQMCTVSSDQGEASPDPHYLEAPESSITTSSETTTKESSLFENVENSEDDITKRGGASCALAPPWWARAQRELEGQATRATYDLLFRHTTARRDGEQAVIVAPSAAAAAHLPRWAARILAAIRAGGGGATALRIEAP